MTRPISRAGAAIGAALLVIALSAAPALACGGLIGPNGAVNLLRTTTLAGYHDGEEHYVTAFQFAGGGGAFGSLTPLPGIPSSVEKGGDWTLQRLVRETDPVPAAARFDAGRGDRRLGRGPHEGPHRRPRRHGPARRRGGGRRMGDRARLPAPARRARGPRLLRRPLARSSSRPCSTPTRPRSAARRSVTGRRSTSRSRPTTRGCRCGSWPSARPPRSASTPTSTC